MPSTGQIVHYIQFYSSALRGFAPKQINQFTEDKTGSNLLKTQLLEFAQVWIVFSVKTTYN